jgi:hypothetical protein
LRVHEVEKQAKRTNPHQPKQPLALERYAAHSLPLEVVTRTQIPPGSLDIRVTKKVLDGNNVSTLLKKSGCVSVTKLMQGRIVHLGPCCYSLQSTEHFITPEAIPVQNWKYLFR